MTAGDPIPQLTLTAPDGGAFPLDDGGGRPLVVFFFPKADTPGCTTEAKDFSDLAPRFTAAGIRVLGVSRDTPAKLGRFAEKHGLAVSLGSDAGAVTEAFGVWGEKTLYGRKFMGIERATFLFDRAGRLARSWRKVKVAGHAAVVLEAAQSLD